MFGVYTSFYGENSGSLFISVDYYEWQFTVLKTNDGGKTWALMSGVKNNYSDEKYYTEVIDFAFSDNVYTITVRVNGDGVEESFVHFRTADFVEWTTDSQP